MRGTDDRERREFPGSEFHCVTLETLPFEALEQICAYKPSPETSAIVGDHNADEYNAHRLALINAHPDEKFTTEDSLKNFVHNAVLENLASNIHKGLTQWTNNKCSYWITERSTHWTERESNPSKLNAKNRKPSQRNSRLEQHEHQPLPLPTIKLPPQNLQLKNKPKPQKAPSIRRKPEHEKTLTTEKNLRILPCQPNLIPLKGIRTMRANLKEHLTQATKLLSLQITTPTRLYRQTRNNLHRAPRKLISIHPILPHQLLIPPRVHVCPGYFSPLFRWTLGLSGTHPKAQEKIFQTLKETPPS